MRATAEQMLHGFSQVLETVLGEACLIELEDVRPFELTELPGLLGGAPLALMAEAPAAGTLACVLPRKEALHLARRVREAPAGGDALEDADRAILGDLAVAALGGAWQAAGSGTEASPLTAEGVRVLEGPRVEEVLGAHFREGAAARFRFTLGGEEASAGLLLFNFAPSLEATEQAPRQELGSAPAPPREGTAGSTAHPAMLDALLDLPLVATARLGGITMPIGELLELAPGALLELGATSAEPVELLINGAVVARGEVVVVEGKFGVRITEVAPPETRISGLH